MNQKYYLCGYYGMSNCGDDALLLSTMLGARRFFDATDFSISSPRKLFIPRQGAYRPQLVGKQRFKGENRFRQCISAWQADSIIFGGGSVFHCQRDIQTKRLMMKLAGKGPHLALGVGVGPFASCEAERACARFLNECSYVGVRDTQSFAIASAIAPSANVELTFDLAPALTPQIEKNANPPGLESRRGIGVALCPVESLHGDAEGEKKRIRTLAEAITQLYLATREPIFLIDFNGHSQLGDRQVHDELHRHIPHTVPVFRVPYDSNPLRVMTRLAKLTSIISMRLHGSILSYMTDTPVISINYHSKCNGWCEQIGMPKKYMFDASDIDADRLVSVIVDGVERSFDRGKLSINEAYQRSLKNFTSGNIFRDNRLPSASH